MITCPNCGAANRDASRFCSGCGTTLPSQAGRRCPMCGLMNASGNVFCDSCGARLVPMTAPTSQPAGPAEATVVKKGLSLPTKPPGEEPAASVPVPPRARPTPPPQAPAPAAPGASDDWLSSLRGSLPEQPAPEESPDWLGGAQAGPAGEPEFDLAARLRGALEPSPAKAPGPSAPAAPPPAAAEVPDWLASLAPTVVSAKAPQPSTPAAPPPVAPSPAAEVPHWLAQLTPTPTKVPEPPAPAAAEVPDWLLSLAPTAVSAKALEPSAPAAPLPAAPAPAAAEAPDWLAQRTPTPTKAPEPSAPSVPPPAAAEVPDWLAQRTPTPTKAPEPSAPSASPPAVAEVPDWLGSFAPTPAKAPETSAPAPPPLAAAEVPDWLASLAPTKAPEPSAPAVPSPAVTEVPDWLAPLAPPAVSAKAPQPSVPAPPSVPAAPALIGEEAPAPELPPWLKDLGGPQVAPATPTAAAPQTPAEMPDWLKDLGPTAPSATLVSAATPFAELLPSPAAEMPDWLRELKPTEAGAPSASAGAFVEAPAPPVPQTSAVPASGGGELAAARLPPWLQALKPKELQPAAAPQPEEPTEADGLLSGVRGTLPAAAIAWQSLGAGITMRPQITADELARAGALQELLARGAAAPIRREGESRAQKLWSSTQRLLVFAVIAVVVMVPLLPGMSVGLVSVPDLGETGGTMYNSIDALKPNAPVLVAFDYDATQSPEMDAQACVVMRHLFARKASVKVVSLYPAGAAAAQAVIDQLGHPMTGTSSLCGGSPVQGNIEKNLGYRPGQDVAVASILSDEPVSRVIELAATPDTLRWWAEQFAVRWDVMNPNTPKLLAGVSASAGPMAQPYLASKQIKGMIVGVPDAIAYEVKSRESLSTKEKERFLAPLESIALANVALVGLMIVGGLIQLVFGRTPPPAPRAAGGTGDGRRRR